VLPNATGLIKSFATEAECRAGTIRGLSDTHPQPQNDPMFNYRSAVGLITVNRAEVQQARCIPGDDPRLQDGPEYADFRKCYGNAPRKAQSPRRSNLGGALWKPAA